jgi:hypothetical protein
MYKAKIKKSFCIILRIHFFSGDMIESPTLDEKERIVHFLKPGKSENLTKSLPLSILPRGGRQPRQMYVAGPPKPWVQGVQSTPPPHTPHHTTVF